MEEENLNMDMFIEVDSADEYFAEETEIENEEIIDTGSENPELNQNEGLEDPEEVVLDKDPDEIKEEVKDDDIDDPSSNPNLFKSLATLLKEKSLISSDDLDVTDEDSFVELFKKEIERNEYSDLSDYQKEYLKNIREGIPHEKAVRDITQLDQLNTISEDILEEDVELRKRVIFQDFVNRGYSEEKANKLVQRSLEMEVDMEDALDAISSIKEFTKERIDKENLLLKQQKDLQEKEREDNIKKITKEIESLTEVIPGYKVSDNVKNKIKENMFNVVGENPVTKQPENQLMKYQRTNPVDFDKKLYYLFTLTNGFTNFENIKQETQSRALQDLEKAYNSTTKITDPGSPAYLQDPNSYLLDLGDEIVVD